VKNAGFGPGALYTNTTGSYNSASGSFGLHDNRSSTHWATGCGLLLTRYKEDIRSMGDVSDRLRKLRPGTFRSKQTDEKGQKPEQYGLIPEEVVKVMPELVVYT
jgi:hypothetical protein